VSELARELTREQVKEIQQRSLLAESVTLPAKIVSALCAGCLEWFAAETRAEQKEMEKKERAMRGITREERAQQRKNWAHQR
jgi:hypothetical protein